VNLEEEETVIYDDEEKTCVNCFGKFWTNLKDGKKSSVIPLVVFIVFLLAIIITIIII